MRLQAFYVGSSADTVPGLVTTVDEACSRKFSSFKVFCFFCIKTSVIIRTTVAVAVKSRMVVHSSFVCCWFVSVGVGVALVGWVVGVGEVGWLVCVGIGVLVLVCVVTVMVVSWVVCWMGSEFLGSLSVGG